MQTVSDVMTRDACFVAPGESLQRAVELMGELDVGALPVCDDQHRLVGIVSLADLTRKARDDGQVGQAVERVSAPAARIDDLGEPLRNPV